MQNDTDVDFYSDIDFYDYDLTGMNKNSVGSSRNTLQPSQKVFLWIAIILGIPANLSVMVVSLVHFKRAKSEIAQTCLILNMTLAGRKE